LYSDTKYLRESLVQPLVGGILLASFEGMRNRPRLIHGDPSALPREVPNTEPAFNKMQLAIRRSEHVVDETRDRITMQL
jgi:hypothetical protein